VLQSFASRRGTLVAQRGQTESERGRQSVRARGVVGVMGTFSAYRILMAERMAQTRRVHAKSLDLVENRAEGFRLAIVGDFHRCAPIRPQATSLAAFNI